MTITKKDHSESPDAGAAERRSAIAQIAIGSGLIAPSKDADPGRVRELASEMHIALDGVLAAEPDRGFDSFGPEFERMAALVRDAHERGLTKGEIEQVMDEIAARIRRLPTMCRFFFEMTVSASGAEFKKACDEILPEE